MPWMPIATAEYGSAVTGCTLSERKEILTPSIHLSMKTDATVYTVYYYSSAIKVLGAYVS